MVRTAYLYVVHFLSDPEALAQDRVRFTVDLGTAPVDAFEELLDAVDALAAGAVRIGRP